ncbi:MAG: hypothetical protein PWQ57_888 [Desulfovibrionales bacterium]|jgi:phage gp16-like protein|nr:hypothetical protein [Desulfovibrionales bacterium]
MTTKAHTHRKTLLAQAHMAPMQLGMSDEDRRAVLQNLFGVDSCKHLTVRQLDQLIRHFEKCGWAPSPRRKAEKQPKRSREPEMLAKVQALLSELHAVQGDWHPWHYATAILRRMYGVERLEWANAKQLRGVIAALHRHLQRRADANELDAFQRLFPTFKPAFGGRA